MRYQRWESKKKKNERSSGIGWVGRCDVGADRKKRRYKSTKYRTQRGKSKRVDRRAGASSWKLASSLAYDRSLLFSFEAGREKNKTGWFVHLPLMPVVSLIRQTSHRWSRRVSLAPTAPTWRQSRPNRRQTRQRLKTRLRTSPGRRRRSTVTHDTGFNRSIEGDRARAKTETRVDIRRMQRRGACSGLRPWRTSSNCLCECTTRSCL